jgi:diguanylate cyclase (GGDEF)-like protein
MLRSTAIWNRDSILELLTRELARTARENGQLSVMLVGIDQFQEISREHGQTQAEAVVAEIAKRLSSALRPYDHVGRYNTEQLLIVAPGYMLSDAMPVAEKLREAIADSPIVLARTNLRATVCISVASLDDSEFHDDDDLLRTLERVLYRTSTMNGGNKVVAAGKLAEIKARIRPARRLNAPVVIAVTLAVGFLALFFVAPAWTCAPFRASDIIDSSELPPPLPPDCFPTADRPSDAILQALDSQREAQGLALQRTVTCKVRLPAGSAGRAARVRNQKWMDEVYSGGSIQYHRHVLLAASEESAGGTLFTVELSLMPWWKYVNGAGDTCWSQLAFWK